MSSIQERLQLKRVPLDTWNIREKLCLASAVVRSGDQNWMSVSRSLKTIGDPNRPPDWYSQKSCAAQYGALLEHVETPKRKKRTSEGGAETPQESILKRLTQERINEIQESVAEINRQYEVLKNEIAEARSPNCTEERLREMLTEIETAKRARERENARRAAWLKEREEKRARAEKTWRPPIQPNAAGVATAPSSPLLTSLLKSSPVVTTPQNISHPANVIETVSPSAGAPTLSMLLETNKTQDTPRPASPENKHAAIEHIKSQLVQIERQLKEKASTPPPPPPAVDIDDIEIKAEDVYAFRDVDLHDIPPVASMHKTVARSIEKSLNKKEEVVPIVDVSAEVPVVELTVQEIKEEVLPPPTPVPQELEVSPTLQNDIEVPIDTTAVESETSDAAGLSIGFPTPEIKVIPSEEPIKTEAKDGAEDDKVDVEEDINVEVVEEISEQQPNEPAEPLLEPVEPEPVKPQPVEPQPIEPEVIAEVVSSELTVETFGEVETPDVALAVESIVEEPAVGKSLNRHLNEPSELEPVEPQPVVPELIAEVVSTEPTVETIVEVEPPDVALAVESVVEEPAVGKSQNKQLKEPSQQQQQPEPVEPQPVEPEVIAEVLSTEPIVEIIVEIEPPDVALAVESVVEEPTVEPPLPEEAPPEEREIKDELIKEKTEDKTEEKIEVKVESGLCSTLVEIEPEQAENQVQVEEQHPVPEVSQEEEPEVSQPPTEPEVKDELPVESEETHTETDDDAPMEVSREEEKDGKKRRDYSRKAISARAWSGSDGDSPGRGSEAERQQRAHRKQHMLVYSRLCAHRYASLFLRPITDDEAPGYSLVVKRPMDLSTIRKNIESGAIRTTAEFQRDVLLMLSNALMYNSSEHSVYAMTKEMMEEAQNQLTMLVAAQAHAGLEPVPPARRKRRRPPSPQQALTPKRAV